MDIDLNMIGVQRIVDSLHAQGKAAGLTVRHLAWDVMANACNNIVKLSPPRTSSGGSWNEQLKLGEKSLADDLHRLFHYPETTKYIVFRNLYDGKLYLRMKADDAVVQLPDDALVAAGGMRGIHERNRTRRGRVVAKPPPYFAQPWDLRAYIKARQQSVGKLKSGWQPAANYFASRVRKRWKYPGWITRHSEPGQAIDQVSQDGNGYLQADNNAPHAGAIRRDALTWVSKKAARDIDKWLPKRAEKIAERIAAASTDAGVVA